MIDTTHANLENITDIKAPTLSYSFAKQHGIFIHAIEQDVIVVMHRPHIKAEALIELRRFLHIPIKLQEISNEEFETRLAQAYETDSQATMEMVEGIEEEMALDQLIHTMPKPEDLLETQDDAPIIRLINALLTQAIKQQASDIHVETFETRVVIRFRIDGILREVISLPRILSPLLISRIKVMAKLDIAEKRLPQDGRITLRIAGHQVDVRVSTIPASHGERVVLRLLDKKTARLDLSMLGMDEESLKLSQALIASPHGIILVTGPTGSGKTTSLYAMLTELNQSSRNILTVEDPIEYDLPGIGQTQVNTKVEMTFARGLRAILRQDPDIVMVGEIRDLETAEIAVQASLTGHLVLSTLHTNSAIGAIARLRDMGVETFLLASSLIGLIAQRLIRVLCPECKVTRVADSAENKLMGFVHNKKTTLYEAKGCAACDQTGYQGRTGIYELIMIDETLRAMIHNNDNQQKLENYVRTTTLSMRQYGIRKVLAGISSLEEVLRVSNKR